MKSGACITMRPDPVTGQLMPVTVSPARKPAQAYAGSYGVWDDQVQAWEIGPCSLEGAIAANVSGTDGYVCRFGGEYFPRNLSKADQAVVKRARADAKVKE